MPLSTRDAEHVFQRLRDGTVPDRGLEAFAVGIDAQRNEIHRLLRMAKDDGLVKFLRGGYGCGKTFMCNLARHDAQKQGFVTSFVVVSDNDLHFHKFDELYRKVVGSLSTPVCAQGALSDILDRWIGSIEEHLIGTGISETAPDFEERVRAAVKSRLAEHTRGKVPAEMVRVLQAVFDLKQSGDFDKAAGLLSWLAGSQNVAADLKKLASVKGEITSTDAMAYLRGIVEIIRSAGYQGLVIVIDEAETILRMRSDARQKSMNAIRQIMDDAKSYPGLLWIITGTPEFFDTRKGVAGTPALDERIRFQKENEFVNMRQPQLELKPFDEERLRLVAFKLRELHPEVTPEEARARVSDDYIDRLVAEVTQGFHRDVGVVPRQFLRKWVNVLDQVAQHPEFNPSKNAAPFQPVALTPEEESVLTGKSPATVDDEEESAPGAAVEF